MHPANAKEIALCKAWVYVSENSRLGNRERCLDFGHEVLQYMESKTRMYDPSKSVMVEGYGRWCSDRGSDKRYKTYGSSSFNAEYREASINLNVDVGDDDGDEVQFDDRLAGTKRKSYDHLIGDVRTTMEALRAEIKAKYNLPY
ncbi:hypothetical protein Tco_0344541 [Tanacetum coccineum]